MPPGTGEVGPQDLPQSPSRRNLPFQLPLVCHLGYPVALEHLSRKSLVTFVTFLLHHGRTADKRTAAAVRRLTRIWPGALSATGPSGVDGLDEWPPGRLRRLVCSWYRVLGCETLLSLSATLERENSRGRLRLQRNADGTSSLWERSSDRLVVTFRDDTRYNGRPGSSCDSLSAQSGPAAAAVQPPPPDCAQCGTQFATPAAAMAHERLCDGMGAGSDSESVRSEPMVHSISQDQFLGYLGMVSATGGPDQAQTEEQQQQRKRRRRRCWPSAELLLRLRRADFSSPLGRRMLAETRQPDAIGGGSAARQDRHCCSRAVRAPPAEFPVTWRRPARQPAARPRLYCFTARQRAERAAAIRGSAGLSARPQALTGRVRPCSVVLRRLKSVGAPRTAARVLLPRLTEAEIAAWLEGSGGRSPPGTPDGGRRPPPAQPTGGLRRRRIRQQPLRDERKAIRDADFFHLLDCDGRVTRGGRKVPQPPVTGKPVRPRSRSEGDPLAGDCCGVVRDGDFASRRKATRSCRRRMSLLESMQDRLHAGTSSADVDSPASRPAERFATASLACRVSPRRVAVSSASPCTEGSDSGVAQPAGRRATSAAGDGARRRPVAINQLLSDECKTLRDRQFTRLLNQPSRTTRSAASSERLSSIRVWLHWPGFAREPDHQTPVKHARAAGEPRLSRAPVVRLERLFQCVAPAGGGGEPPDTLVTPLSPGGGAVRCRRRLDPDTADAELTARFLSRCRRQILPAAEARGEQVRPAMAAVTAPPPSSPPPPLLAPSSPLSTPPGYVSVGPAPDVDYCKPAVNGCWPGSLKLRPRSRLRKALSESGMSDRLMPVGVLLDTVNNNGINSFGEPEIVRNRSRHCPGEFLAGFGLPLKMNNVKSSSLPEVVGKRPRRRPRKFNSAVDLPIRNNMNNSTEPAVVERHPPARSPEEGFDLVGSPMKSSTMSSDVTEVLGKRPRGRSRKVLSEVGPPCQYRSVGAVLCAMDDHRPSNQ